MHSCCLRQLGRVDYPAALQLQQQLAAERKQGLIPDQLLLLEHPHVITLGRNGHMENLLAGDDILARAGIAFYPTDRGGDVTYHGPGQLVGYPILDLAGHRRDVRWYVEQLEEVMLRLTSEFGIDGKRVAGRHGVWVEGAAGEEKLAALGLHLSRWVTSHGFAYNVSTDLRFFDLIVPCGIPEKRATSLERLLSREVSIEQIRSFCISHFAKVFGRTMIPVSREDLEALLKETAATEPMRPSDPPGNPAVQENTL